MSGSAVVRWTVRVVGVVLVLALAALLVLRVYWSRRLVSAERDVRERLGPAVASAFAPPNIPDEENAAFFLRAGAEALILLGDDELLVGDLGVTPPLRWTESQRSDLRRIVAGNAPALELLARAVGLRRSYFGMAETTRLTLSPRPMPLLLRALWAQRLLYDDSLLALQEHDFPRLLARADVMSAMAAALEREPVLVAELVGVGCEKMLLGVVEGAAASPGLDATAISRLEHAVVRMDLHEAWERMMARVALDRLRPEASEGYGGLSKVIASVIPGWYEAPAIEYCSKLINALDRPYGTDLNHAPIMPAYAPNLVRAAARNQVVLSQRRLATLGLALRRQALETGTYPTALTAFPEASKRDPFTGGRLVYTRAPDGSAQLTVPDGVKLWDEANPEVHNPGPFTWELPAPPNPARRKVAER